MTPNPSQRVLIVDDDHAIRRLLIEYLAAHGYAVDGASTVADARRAFAERAPHIVLLDLGLPDGDGVDLARRWREQSDVGIICVTGRDDEVDRVMGLELGADDFVIKPFSLRELLARMHAVMRRTGPPRQLPVTRGQHPRAYRFAGWLLNLNTRRLFAPDGAQVDLTNSEFNLLVVFLGAPQRIVTREECLDRTRAFDDIFDRAIDVQILRLRRKLEADPRKPTLLRTARGAGYYLDAEAEALWS